MNWQTNIDIQQKYIGINWEVIFYNLFKKKEHLEEYIKLNKGL